LVVVVVLLTQLELAQVVQVAQETSMLVALQQVELVSALVAVAVGQDILP
jgi:hypothetical protein